MTQIRVGNTFILGFLSSSLLVFALLRAAGSIPAAYSAPLLKQTFVLIALAGASALDIHSLRRDNWCAIGPRRQTPKRILRDRGATRAALAWGLDAGLVFTTFRVSALGWALMLAALLGLAPWWLGAVYGAGFALPLFGGWLTARRLHGDDSGIRMARTLAANAGVGRGMAVLAALVAGGFIAAQTW